MARPVLKLKRFGLFLSVLFRCSYLAYRLKYSWSQVACFVLRNR